MGLVASVVLSPHTPIDVGKYGSIAIVYSGEHSAFDPYVISHDWAVTEGRFINV
jgi:hypothetical protein